MFFAPLEDMTKWSDANYTLKQVDDTRIIVWQKMKDSLPITSLRVDASEPCVNPYYQPQNENQFFYKAELQQ